MTTALCIVLFFAGAGLLFGRRNPWVRALGLTLMFVAGKSYPRHGSRRRIDNQWGE